MNAQKIQIYVVITLVVKTSWMDTFAHVIKDMKKMKTTSVKVGV